jgi:hypothetical protein
MVIQWSFNGHSMVIQWSFTPLSLRDISPEGEKILFHKYNRMTAAGQMTT